MAAQQISRAVQRHHAPAFEHRNPAAQTLGFFQIVRSEHDGVAVTVEARDKFPQGLAQFDIDTGSRLVEHDHRRPVYQRLRHQHAPLHAARQGAHVGIGLGGQVQVRHQFINPGIVVTQPEIAGLDAQGFTHCKERIKHQFLRHHAKVAAAVAIRAHHIVAHHGHAAAVAAGQAGHGANQGGLASPIGAKQAEKLALLHPQADAVQRLRRAKTFFEMTYFDGGSHGF